jgi:hypothetical protein
MRATSRQLHPRPIRLSTRPADFPQAPRYEFMKFIGINMLRCGEACANLTAREAKETRIRNLLSYRQLFFLIPPNSLCHDRRAKQVQQCAAAVPRIKI